MAMKATVSDAVTSATDTSPPGLETLFHALSESARLTILRHLFNGEHRVIDLVAHLGLAQSTVSKHLACLRDCGLVTSRPVGRSSMFSLTQPDRVSLLLAEAERLLTATGQAAAHHDPGTQH